VKPAAWLLVVGLAVTACGSDTEGPPAAATPSSVDGRFVDDSLHALIGDRVVAAHRALAQTATTLAQAAATCPSDRAVVQGAWRAARLAWDAASVYGFGPQTDAHLPAAVDWWPPDAEAVEQVIEGSEPMTADDLEALGAGVRGLPSIELVLFGDAPFTGRRCSYVQRAAESIALHSSEVADSFAASSEQLVSGDDAMVVILSTLSDSVYRICDQQLGMPSGNTVAGGPADATLVRQGRGKMAILDVDAALDEVSAAYNLAFQPIVEARFAGTPDPLEPLMAQFEAAVTTVGDDLPTAILQHPDDVAVATEACRSVRRAFSTNVAAELGVTLILPIGDGD
jgi:Imelysin